MKKIRVKKRKDVKIRNGGIILRNKSIAGFTLIELMIIVSIISILMVIALPKFGKMVQKAKEGRTKGNLGALRSAVNIYYADNEGWLPYWSKIVNRPPPATAATTFVAPWALAETLVPQYIGEIPGVYTGQRGAWGADSFGGIHEENNRVYVNWVLRSSAVYAKDAAAGIAHPTAPGKYEYLYYVCIDPTDGTEGYNGHIWINCDLLDTKEEKIIFW